jgi:hypothetical protein
MRRYLGLAVALAASIALSLVVHLSMVAGFPWPELLPH